MTDSTLLLGHSPDPDDAFMFYGLASGQVASAPWQFQHELADIQTLNERALRGELHITAISIHAYPLVADRYALTSCGASVGDGYGPLVVAREPLSVADLAGKLVAVPGELTTAFLVLNLLLGRGNFRHEVVMFDEIPQHVAEGRADAGLLIHEGQLTFGRQQLHKIIDLGAWWQQETSGPLPLGGNCVRRDLGAEDARSISGIIRESIQYGLDHRADAVAYALRFARDLDRELADRFIGLYVNDWTLDYGSAGRRAVAELLERAAAVGLVNDPGPIDFIG